MTLAVFIRKVLNRLFPKPKKSGVHGSGGKEIRGVEFVNLSFSQEGEDLILSRIFQGRNSGFYVDVGAHHPMKYSNTYKFYLKGWRGINIDALPGSMKAFDKFRPEDINLELPISMEPQMLTYFMFNEPALNTFDKDLAKTYQSNEHYHIIDQRELQTTTLAEVLKTHARELQEINFLTVDVEGLDADVLESNDWIAFRPQYVVTECIDVNMRRVSSLPINKILEDRGYILFAKTVNSLIFKDNKLMED